MSVRANIIFSISIVCSVFATENNANANNRELLAVIASTDGTDEADQAASKAVRQLQSLPSTEITDVLSGFNDASQRGRNWLRALAADVADNGEFPESELLKFFNDRSGDADARYVAFQLLVGNDNDAKAKLLANAATDPSLPVRYLKIQSLIDAAEKQKDESPGEAKETLQQVVQNARSANQLEKATAMLSDLGVKVDLADTLGMMTQWWAIGPFDNTDSKNFDTEYTPEQRYLESGSPIATTGPGEPQTEKGKDGQPVTWLRIDSDDKLGMVDLNAPLKNAKDATAYVYCRFSTDSESADFEAQIRLGCITANKVWVNGKLVTSNEVYHSGSRIDQYVAPCTLSKGENTVMIKVLQNAQTEPWAQDYQFQFRLTRPDGSPVKTSVIEPKQ
ncbi:hypothetical protein ACMFWY_14935 [Roseiconus sp. JC912]